MLNIGILGAGTWGMSIAKMLSETGKNVQVWSALPQEIEFIRENKKHPNLKNIIVPNEITYTINIEELCKNKDIIVFVVPSTFVRSTAKAAKNFIPKNQIIVDLAKGLESNSLLTMTEVIENELHALSPRLVALSGPTHAEELALRLPTTIVAASKDLKAAQFIQNVFSSPYMRVYTNDDVKGIEISAALKNVIAIAAGISTGLGYGDNAKAALITRGMAEITRLGLKLGGKVSTFTSLAGIGDLIVTCTSQHSRNNKAGFLLGKGYTVENAVKEVGMVVEGLNALPAAIEMANKYKVDMPICETVYSIVNGEISPKNAVDILMGREPKHEYQGDFNSSF